MEYERIGTIYIDEYGEHVHNLFRLTTNHEPDDMPTKEELLERVMNETPLGPSSTSASWSPSGRWFTQSIDIIHISRWSGYAILLVNRMLDV